jgi:hypothetical protein
LLKQGPFSPDERGQYPDYLYWEVVWSRSKPGVFALKGMTGKFLKRCSQCAAFPRGEPVPDMYVVDASTPNDPTAQFYYQVWTPFTEAT